MFSINKFAQGKSPIKYGLIHCKKFHSLEWFRVLISYDIFEYFKISRQLRLQPLWRRRKNWQFLCDYPGYDTPRWNIFATSLDGSEWFSTLKSHTTPFQTFGRLMRNFRLHMHSKFSEGIHFLSIPAWEHPRTEISWGNEGKWIL